MKLSQWVSWLLNQSKIATTCFYQKGSYYCIIVACDQFDILLSPFLTTFIQKKKLIFVTLWRFIYIFRKLNAWVIVFTEKERCSTPGEGTHLRNLWYVPKTTPINFRCWTFKRDPLIRSVPRRRIPISISVTSCHTMEFGDSGGVEGGRIGLKTAKRGAS